ncbi:MAG: hypothetical protein LBN39_08275 [Planctomycetaceae bacterium]|jgi:hypothetical protein|nr:hypothetical protein [Planctomycetaceae bacterium]
MISEQKSTIQILPASMFPDEVPSQASYRAAFERRKKFFAENPGKTLAEALPFLPKERCDTAEAYFWKKVEEEKEASAAGKQIYFP